MIDIDALESRQRARLIGYAAAFAVWGGALTAGFLLPHYGAPKNAIFAVAAIGVIAWIFWMTRLIAYFRGAHAIKSDPEAREALGDERMRANSNKAFATAFWGLLVAAGLYIGADTMLQLDAPAIAIATGAIWIGVTVALTAFLVFDR